MYSYSITAGKEVLGEDEKRKRSLVEELEEIERKYNANPSGAEVDAPESLELERLDYSAPTDEEIAAAADAEAQAYADRKAQELEREKQFAEQSAAASRERAGQALEENLSRIDSDYDARKTAAENQALKRGLARSSIIMGQIEAFDGARLAGRQQQHEGYASQIQNIENSLYELEQSRISAIEALDGQKLELIAGRIKELTDERDKKLAEVIKYNNTVAEKQAQYSLSRDKALKDAQNQALKNSSAADIAAKVSAEKEKAVQNFFSGMSAQDAVAMLLTDARLREKLGSSYIYLLNHYRSKI